MKNQEKDIDKFLVSNCLAGDKPSFNRLVKRYHQNFLKKAYWYSKDSVLAKDVVQESWIKIFENLNQLKDPASFRSWALSIVIRKAIDAERLKTKINNNKSEYKSNNSGGNEIGLNQEVKLRNPKSTIVLQEIKLLPENQKQILRMFYLEENSLMEISKLLGVSIGTVKSRLFYAREKLKTKIKN